MEDGMKSGRFSLIESAGGIRMNSEQKEGLAKLCTKSDINVRREKIGKKERTMNVVYVCVRCFPMLSFLHHSFMKWNGQRKYRPFLRNLAKNTQRDITFHYFALTATQNKFN